MADDKQTRRSRSSAQSDPDVERDQQPATLDECRRCTLWRNATQAVPGEGPRRASIMLVGEQPGDAEDLQGRPFVGPAGALLDKALEEAGLKRKDVYVTNAVKHFKWTPRGKRRMHKTPGQREIEACGYWLEQELRTVRARVIVALGATALKAVLDDSHARLQDALGKTIGHGEHLVVATYHPSFALRAPDPETRRHVYDTIVAALQTADKLGHK
ncbi:uracil-DNA glycosylase, 4 family protein [Paraburkholderia xenovorans LB400]|jgi:uracil-DNA glycosylase|uniref:Type-4 uracil-DNA glycosylase n=1 Tax=Paraburkholderia xenovorans (strain LB400) TaxID=266265 RepID=Q13K47_PARXL|nr:UdgX family uracil-DNA binding protein [Paraburkholderia xenovorans]ABE35542.1 Phage SPO1 DNA polymerase-related protein [Paraburkholderia xenovorans LB400]AIP36521.1 uracil-DNA glycosylase, 4 family protein [Paraburkholderia xenovorans LB400]